MESKIKGGGLKFIFILTALLFSTSGCATVQKVNEDKLIRLYAYQRSLPKKNPVVFIPGIMGTILQDKNTGRTVWGEVGKRLLDALALPIDTVTLILNRDSLIASRPLGKLAVIPGLLEKRIYDKVYDIAIEAGGYEIGKDAFALIYDWRRDFIEAVFQLDELIEEIKLKTGRPDLKVDLVCHSAGGLIARYYVKYGTEDVLDSEPVLMPTYAGAKNINKVIMLGAPNSGSLEAFERLHEGFHIPMIGYLTPEVIFTMPSVFESLPFDGKNVFIDSGAEKLRVDLYDPDNWEKYGWSVFNPERRKKLLKKFIKLHGGQKGKSLYEEHIIKQKKFLEIVLKRAERFHQALYQGSPSDEKQRVRYMLLGSSCQPTLKAAFLKQADPGWKTLFDAHTSRIRDGLYGLGDGSVTKESLLGINFTLQGGRRANICYLPAFSEVFVCETHGDLATSPMYMDNVLHMLIGDAGIQDNPQE